MRADTNRRIRGDRLEELRQIERTAQTSFDFQETDPATVRCNSRTGENVHSGIGEMESKTGAGIGFQKVGEFVTSRPFDPILEKLGRIESTAKGIVQGIDDAMARTFEMVPEVILWENTVKGGDR